MAGNISVRVKDLKLDKYQALAEAAVLDALDVVAGEVQEHARGGHPKIAPGVVKLAARAMSQAEILDKYRERTGGSTGEYKGLLRWLTHTGATRNSIFIEKARVEGSGFTRKMIARVYSAQKHAPDLEFGGPGRRAFPFMRPALAAKHARLPALLTAALKKAEGRL